MIEAPKHLRGVDLVLNTFGYWPSFHDARIRGVRVDGSNAGSVMFALHVSEVARDEDARGKVRLRKHREVLFRFEDVVEVAIWERDDTLFALQIASELGADGRFRVVLDSATGSEAEGYGGSFRARSGAVLAAIPIASE